MMRRKVLIFSTIVWLGLCAGGRELLGQNGSRVTVFGGASFLGGERFFIVDDDPFESEFENGAKFGFRLTTDWTDVWALEASYGFSNNDLRITELEEFEERRFDIGTHEIIGNVLYYFAPPDESFRPFATAGLGWTRFSPSDDAQLRAIRRDFIEEPAAIEASNKFNFNFGGGFETRASEWLGARIDVRDHITGHPRFGLPERARAGEPFFPVDGSIHNVEVTVGAVIYLP